MDTHPVQGSNSSPPPLHTHPGLPLGVRDLATLLPWGSVSPSVKMGQALMMEHAGDALRKRMREWRRVQCSVPPLEWGLRSEAGRGEREGGAPSLAQPGRARRMRRAARGPYIRGEAAPGRAERRAQGRAGAAGGAPLSCPLCRRHPGMRPS